MDWSRIIYHVSADHLKWALAEKERLDNTPVPEGKVVFLGSNPSCSSPYNDPFSHCKSANKILGEWIPALGLTRDQIHFMNVANYKTVNNRPLKKSEIKAEVLRLAIFLQGQIVVTLGKAAEEAMELVLDDYCMACEPLYKARPTVINMPHPSGRNRLLNDKAWVANTLATAKGLLDAARNNVAPTATVDEPLNTVSNTGESG